MFSTLVASNQFSRSLPSTFYRNLLVVLLGSSCWLNYTAAVSADEIPRIQVGRMRVELERLIDISPADALLFPVFMAAPDDGTGRLFFLEKGNLFNPIPPTPPLGYRALVRTYSNGTFGTFLDLSAEVHPQSEGGLLGLAFHPGFADPISPGYRKLYTFHSAVIDENAAVDFDSDVAPIHHQNVLTEWQANANNPNQVDLSSRREIFRQAHPSDIHNSGNITFGPDGYLYGSIGTPPLGAAQLLTAQDNSDILGTIYRIDPLAPSLTPGSPNPISANGKYRIPADNPFVNDPLALDEIYAYGLRNAYRFSIDPVSGLLFAGEVGNFTSEEVNVIPKGGNMGWPYREGSQPGPVTAPIPPPTFVPPITEYSHADGTAIIGGHVYRGSIAALQGKYVFGDFSTNFFSNGAHGRLLIADVFNEVGQLKNSAEIEIQELLEAPATCSESPNPNPSCAFDIPIMSMGLGADGELYVVGFTFGRTTVYKFTDAYVLPEGDYNEDGVVDAADYTVWRDTVGQSVAFGAKADGDGSGMIDAGDYDIWKAHFGESVVIGAASGSQNIVPGPHSFMLAFQVVVGMMASIRKWQLRRHSARSSIHGFSSFLSPLGATALCAPKMV